MKKGTGWLAQKVSVSFSDVGRIFPGRWSVSVTALSRSFRNRIKRIQMLWSLLKTPKTRSPTTDSVSSSHSFSAEQHHNQRTSGGLWKRGRKTDTGEDGDTHKG